MSETRVEVSSELKQQAKESNVSTREAKTIVAIGERGVGKTFTTLKFFKEDYTVSRPNKIGRKALIFDTNGEFEDIDPIGFNQVNLFKAQTTIEVRRILASIHPTTGKPLGIDGKAKLLEDLLEVQTPRNMGLLLEDLNSYVIGATSKKMIDVLTTNRHRALDIFIHLQTFRSVPPRIWGNMNILRLHKTGDSVDQIKTKVRNFPLTKVGNLLVQEKCKIDPRFFVYIDYDSVKIIGKFDRAELYNACLEYLVTEEHRAMSNVARFKKVSIDVIIEQRTNELLQAFSITNTK